MADSVDRLPGAESEPPARSSAPRPDKRALHRKTLKFVVVFVVSVFALLFGYEMMRWSKANDWYLLQVARSTTFLLKHVGYSCVLGSQERFRGREKEVRDALAAWNRGEDPAPVAKLEQPGPNDEPLLTPWEAWEYQAAGERKAMRDATQEVKRLRADATLAEPERTRQVEEAKKRLMQMKQRDTGPLVSFVLKPGPVRRLADANAELGALQQQPGGDEPSVAKLQAEIAKLDEEVKADREKKGPGPRPRKELLFNFVVIPDCGAVQSMAIFFAAVLAFPSPWRKRAVGLVIGLPALYWVNAFRLAFLAVIGAWDNGGRWFKFTHEYIWQGIYIVFVVALWMGWVELLVRRRPHGAAAAQE